MPDRLERPWLALEPEPQLQDPPLALRQRIERTPDTLLAQRLLGFVERIRSLAVGEEIAELTLVVGTHGLVQRDRSLRCAKRLVDMLNRQSGRLGELVLRRLAPELDLEPACGAAELLLALDNMNGNANRARVICNRTLDRLANPPGRIGRELVPAPPIELLDCAVQAERPLLDQIQERHAEPTVALCDRDDQSQVRLDHAPLGEQVTALDGLCEHHFVRRRQQLVLADVGQEELEAVGRADERRSLGRGLFGGGLLLLGLLRPRLTDLEADRLELARELLDLVVGEIVLEGERLELCGLEVPALLGSLDNRASLLGFQQFLQLVLGQLGL